MAMAWPNKTSFQQFLNCLLNLILLQLTIVVGFDIGGLAPGISEILWSCSLGGGAQMESQKFLRTPPELPAILQAIE